MKKKDRFNPPPEIKVTFTREGKLPQRIHLHKGDVLTAAFIPPDPKDKLTLQVFWDKIEVIIEPFSLEKERK